MTKFDDSLTGPEIVALIESASNGAYGYVAPADDCVEQHEGCGCTRTWLKLEGHWTDKLYGEANAHTCRGHKT
jgi:hypothetical protein